MRTCTCGKPVAGSQLCLILYDTAVAGSQKKITRALGAIETVRCERCLAREGWRQTGRNLLSFLLGVVVISVLAGLIGKVFHLAWVGGGILILGLLFGLVKNLLTVVKRTARNGAALCAQREYRSQGYLPREDLLFLNQNGVSLSDNNCISLEKLEGLHFLTVEAAEDALQHAPPDTEEILGIREAIDRARSLGSPDVITALPDIRKAFCFPLAAGFLLLLMGAIAIICLFDIPDAWSAGRTDVVAMEGLIAVTALGGALGLVLRKKPVWYAPLAVAAVLLWVLSAKMWGEYLSVHLMEPLILSLAIVVPAFCFLPYVLRKRASRAETIANDSHQ